MAKEKEGGFDDPQDSLDMSVSQSTPYPVSLSAEHHDVIIHALNHSSQQGLERGHEVTTAPQHPKTTKVKAPQKGGRNGFAQQHHVGNGNGIAANGGVAANGTGHRNSDRLSPTCPPPDYDELFLAESATPIRYTNGHHGNGHRGGNNRRTPSNDDDGDCGSDGEGNEKGRV